MEIILRTFYHLFLKFFQKSTGFENTDAYIYNIKRIETIIRNDYRNFTGEEFSGESKGSCSVVSEDVQSSECVERTDDFEFPNKNEAGGPEQDIDTKSDACSSEPNRCDELSDDSHGDRT